MQRYFGLTADGTVGNNTWHAFYVNCAHYDKTEIIINFIQLIIALVGIILDIIIQLPTGIQVLQVASGNV